MRRRRSRATGFVLLPVILAMTLIAAIAFLLNRDNGVNAEMVADQSDMDRARYAAEAGLQVVNASIQGNNCSGFYPSFLTPKTNSNFGDASYWAYSNPPYGNSTTLTSTGSYNGTSVTLTRSNVIAYQANPRTYILQPGPTTSADTYVNPSLPGLNYGKATSVQVGNGVGESLLKFDFSILPTGSRIVQYYSGGALQPGATLSMYQTNKTGSGSASISAHLMTRSWAQGTGNIPADGATWNTYDGINAWPSPGMGYDPTPIATIPYANFIAWNNWDISDAVTAWMGNVYPNNGIWIKPSSGLWQNVSYFSSDSSSASQRPKVTIQYLLPCGATEPSGGGPPQNVLMVVANATALNAQETARKALIESWAYKVNAIDDNDTQTNFTAAFANNLAVYVPQTVDSTALSSKLYAAPIGIVNENILHALSIDLGKVGCYGNFADIDILDNTHSITTGYALGSKTILSSPKNLVCVTSGLASGAQKLATIAGNASMFTLNKGDGLATSGTFAAGKRVQLPWGYTGFDVNALNATGLEIMRRALEWAADGTAPPTSGTTVTLRPVADSYLDTKSPNSIYGTAGTLLVGGDLSKSNVFNGLFNFNVLASIPANAKVVSATLRLYENSKGSGGTLTLDAHRVTRAWLESEASANKAEIAHQWTSVGGDYDPTAVRSINITNAGKVWDEWDITPLVQEWLDGISPDFGVVLRRPSGSGNPQAKYDSRESGGNAPELVIIYQ